MNDWDNVQAAAKLMDEQSITFEEWVAGIDVRQNKLIKQFEADLEAFMTKNNRSE